ncbi:hypothetical protein XENOCAPTIV_020363, partial [Xenoophorus captivus]
ITGTDILDPGQQKAGAGYFIQLKSFIHIGPVQYHAEGRSFCPSAGGFTQTPSLADIHTDVNEQMILRRTVKLLF